MPRKLSFWLSPFLALALLLVPIAAHAQYEGFALSRYNPSERGSDWFANESLDLRGHVRPALGLVGDWAFKPLVLYEPGGEKEISTVVRHQVFVHPGASLVLWDRLRAGVSLPVLIYNKSDEVDTVDGELAADEGVNLGDLRASLDLRLLGEYATPFTLAAGVQVHFPTGSRDAYAGDGRMRVHPRLMAAGQISSFVYAAQAGFNYRAQEGELDGAAFGSEMTFSAAVGVRLLDDTLQVGPELYGSTVVSEGDAAFARRTTPFEGIFGAKLRLADQFLVGGGIGPGLSRGFGSPAVRTLASFEWIPAIEEEPPPPAPPPSDRDGDGIIDDEDACPDTPGVENVDATLNGCPPPKDTDGDGIIDDEDACIDTPGVANDDPQKNGCPPDSDGDGILDGVDACPEEPGLPNEDDPAKHGCPPPPDTDGDGILDAEDACPKDAGEPNENPKKHGCPAVIVTEEKIEIMERVEFETASAKLLPESDQILEAVRAVLEKHTEITKVRVEGHTDDRGDAGYNKRLSQRRAASVVKWLTDHGIAADRLVSEGFGEDKPIETNDTEEGRQNNRRVEFMILETNKQSGDASETEPGDDADGDGEQEEAR